MQLVMLACTYDLNIRFVPHHEVLLFVFYVTVLFLTRNLTIAITICILRFAATCTYDIEGAETVQL